MLEIMEQIESQGRHHLLLSKCIFGWVGASGTYKS